MHTGLWILRSRNSSITKYKIYLHLVLVPAAISYSTNGCLLSTTISPRWKNSSYSFSWHSSQSYSSLGAIFSILNFSQWKHVWNGAFYPLMKWSTSECQRHSSGSFMHRRKLNNCLHLENFKSRKWWIRVAAPSHAAALKHRYFGMKVVSSESSALALLEVHADLLHAELVQE